MSVTGGGLLPGEVPSHGGVPSRRGAPGLEPMDFRAVAEAVVGTEVMAVLDGELPDEDVTRLVTIG